MIQRIFRTFSTQIKQRNSEDLINTDKYIYSRSKLKAINDPKLIQKLEAIQEQGRAKHYVNRSLQFPLLMCAGTLFLYHLWQVMPYSRIFKHTTVSEYMKELIYPALLTGMAHQTTQSICTYGPLLIYGLFLNGKVMKYKGLLTLYMSNTIIQSIIAYVYEKYKNEQQGIQMVSPKTLGACTPLAYMSCFATILPKHLIFGKVPFIVIPLLYSVYEIEEQYLNEDDSQCRVAHISSIVYGVLFGLMFKRLYH